MEASHSVLGPIIVGIPLDPFFQADNDQDALGSPEVKTLLHVAQGLARRLQRPARLISVWESKLMDMVKAFQRLPHINWHRLQLDSLTQAMRDKIQEYCEQQLKKIAENIDSSIQVSERVMTAKHPAQGILAEAQQSQASLILLGSGSKADNFLTQGFSTALTTMASATVPVIVAGSRCQTDFSRPQFRVLIADDLREVTAPAMQSAGEWVQTLQATELLHLHVEELSLERVKQVLGMATVELRSTMEWEKLSADLMQALDISLQENMKRRIPGVNTDLASRGGSIKTEVRRCPLVREEIERAADAFDADMIIFGRHQKVHQRPSMVGRVTYQAMLSQKRAIMVVP